MTTYESDNTQGKQREREKNILIICSQTDCQNVLLLKPSILKFKWLDTNLVPVWTDSMWTPVSWNTSGSTRNQHCLSPTATIQVRTNESAGSVFVPSSAHTNKLPKKQIPKRQLVIEDIGCQSKKIGLRIFVFLCSDKGHWPHGMTDYWC